MMNSFYENRLYCFWLLKKFYNIEIYIFYLKKIYNKIFKKKKISLIKNYKIKLSDISIPKNFETSNRRFNDNFRFKKYIKLATKTIIFKNDINWNLSFEDNEDTESIHRFNWLYGFLYNNPQSKYINWISRQEDIWNRKFIQGKQIKKKTLIWEQYTVSERISNLLIYHFLFNKRITNTNINSYISQLNYLIHNLEFYEDKTGNHYFNNLRSLYIASCVLDIISIKKIIIKEILIQLDHILTEEYFLREGSSHYHFLFTRWLLEIYIFSNEFNDTDFSLKISKILKNVINKVNFFKIIYNDNIEIPMIGDISPDFVPKWLFLVDDFAIKKNISKKFNKKVKNNLWNNIFAVLQKKYNSKLNYETTDHNELNSIYEYNNSGWFRYNYGDFSMIIRQNETNYENHVGHFHNDQFHFCLFFKGKYIFVDNGRSTYQSTIKNSNYSKENFAHNSILINDLGSVPVNSNRYYFKYFKSKNIVKSKKYKNKLYILIQSSAFSRINKDIIVKRFFIFDSNNFKICDKIYGQTQINYKSFFYLKPNISIKKIKNKFILDNEDSNFSFYSSDNINFNIKKMNSIFYSEEYGMYKTSNCISKKINIQLPFKIEYFVEF